MTRSDEPLFEPRIADWLEDDPYTAPDQALDVVLAAFPSIKQRRAWRVPWRVPGMTTPLRFGLTAAAVGSRRYRVPDPIQPRAERAGRSGGPTPSSPPAPSRRRRPRHRRADPLDTARWTTYTSDRYGFSIGYPADWTERPAERNWAFATDAADWLSPGQENFISAPGDLRVSAWSVAVEPGTSAEAWIQSYCEAVASPDQDCSGYLDGAVPVSIEDHSGLLITKPDFDHPVFVLNGDRMYVVIAWRDESDPSVMPYGGARRLVEILPVNDGPSRPRGIERPPS